MKRPKINYITLKNFNKKSNTVLIINTALNNIIINASKKNGDLIFWVSATTEGFTGKQKRSNFASYQCGITTAKKLKLLNIKTVDIKFKGISRSRNSIIRALIKSGITIETLQDITQIPHNGCTAKKKQRK